MVAALPGDQLSGLPKFGWRLARLATRRSARRYRRSDRLAKAVARLGPSYVKLGQFMATRPDVVGNDIALDLALQASPDHPWVTAHPEWFTTLPDGTIVDW